MTPSLPLSPKEAKTLTALARPLCTCSGENDPQAEQERSASLHRSCLEQLETIKTQFYTFLSMFHPDDASAPSGVSSHLSSSGAAFPRSPVSSLVGSHLVSSLNEDMAGLKKRLDTLANSTIRTAATFSADAYRSGGPSVNLSTPRSP